MASWLRIGEGAELFEVSTKTLRHYERQGLLEPEREENGYRLYGPEALLRVQRIRQLQSLGVPLREIGALLEHDDELVWAGVLQTLQEEVAGEIVRLQKRLVQIEELLAHELPPEGEALVDLPAKLNEYLELHLPQSRVRAWRQEQRVFACLSGIVNRLTERGAGGHWPGYAFEYLSHFVGQPMMIPADIGEWIGWEVDGQGRLNGYGERSVYANGSSRSARRS